MLDNCDRGGTRFWAAVWRIRYRVEKVVMTPVMFLDRSDSNDGGGGMVHVNDFLP